MTVLAYIDGDGRIHAPQDITIVRKDAMTRRNRLHPVGVWTEEDQRREEAIHLARWKEACEEKLHDLAMQVSPEEVDGGVAGADIVMGYLRGEYDDGNDGLYFGVPA